MTELILAGFFVIAGTVGFAVAAVALEVWDR